MLNKNILIIILLGLNLTTGLKSSDFCYPKQKECKGFYDEKQNYKVKCNLMKCHGKFSFDCESNLCSTNKTECSKYNQLGIFMKISQEIHTIDPLFVAKHSKEINRVKNFNKFITVCRPKSYELKSDDFCVNGRNCRTSYGYGHLKMIKNVDCKCPIKQSFKCDKYCSVNSDACSYLKSLNKNNKKNTTGIRDCGNHNSLDFKSYFSII